MNKYSILKLGDYMKISVGISNRHVHLTKEIKDMIFGKNYELEMKYPLKQLGQFSSTSKVDIKTDKGVIEGVRVIGPLRKYTQVEILKSDEKILGIHTDLRDSGDLENTPGITIVGPLGEVYVPSCVIIANRHVHMSFEDGKNFNCVNGEIVKIKKNSTIIEDVHIKINDTCVLECHLDKDDEAKYDIHTGDEIEIIK